MRIVYASRTGKAGPGQFWGSMIKIAVLISAAFAVLAVMLIGLIVVLPVVLVGGIALHFYIRRKLRQAQRRHQPQNDVIDAEYTVIERR
ncbi:hypothetical protein MHY87_18585 [Microvirga sp. ACRRW]|uniref:hypothetical protein n=1 Tax=Microvirga sp. ACRRW TaxID=2918205 RepID=UPI001EF45629|nr:hypothetical protein [Microvirga sp. ACRRW]MCG7394909.1 hypothetical protein [Microvirga sp. ACRRW]